MSSTRPFDRSAITGARRLVVKVGSSSLTRPDGGLDGFRLQALATTLAHRALDGVHVVLVSSGAIAAGIEPLRLGKRPKDLATQQAAASAGQGLLMTAYTQAFTMHGVQVGQVLLTANDMHRRSHYVNASRTLERLLELEVVPIINENDTVATDEIRFGDIDRLAALVAHLVDADDLDRHAGEYRRALGFAPTKRGGVPYLDVLTATERAEQRLELARLVGDYADLKRRLGVVEFADQMAVAAQLGIPAPVFSSSLAYYDGLRRDRLPAALTQGLRDLFGAHTYHRVDGDGTFHTMWGEDKREVEAVDTH